MSDETTTSPVPATPDRDRTVLVRRRDGAPRVLSVGNADAFLNAEGDGPWPLKAWQWESLAATTSAFELVPEEPSTDNARDVGHDRAADAQE